MSGWLDLDEPVWTSADGTRRVRAVLDTDPQEPEHDGGMPVLRIIRGRYDDQTRATHVYGSTGYGFDAAAVWDRFDTAHPGYRQTLHVFTRWLAVFRGTTTVWDYEPGDWEDPRYLTFDTAAWREEVGVAEPVDAKEAFEEYHAWLVGECYGLVLEHKVRHDVRTTDLYTGEATAWTREACWQEQDAVWGFYGHDLDQARQHAAGHFDIDAPTTTRKGA